MSGKNDPSTQDPIGNVTGEDGLMELSNQFSGLESPTFRLTRTGHYHCHQWFFPTREKHYLPGHNSKPNNNSTTRLSGKYISYVERFFRLLPQTPQLLNN